MNLSRSVVAAFAILACFTDTARAETGQVFEDEYIIQPDTSPQAQAQHGAALASTTSDLRVVSNGPFASHLKIKRTSGPSFSSADIGTKAVIQNYDPAVAARDCAHIKALYPAKSCEPNFVKWNYATAPNDPGFYDSFANLYTQWGLYSPFTDNSQNFDTRAPFAWDLSQGSDNTIIGVVDSGINLNHPDLQPNLWVNPNEIAGNGIDDDQNGYIDDVNGVDANALTGDPMDCNGHGSHVAGIIGARGNNGIGITGVCWRVKVIMARNAPDCGPSVSTAAAIRGLEYMYNLKVNKNINIRAINGSYGGPNFTEAERTAIARLSQANIVFVAAAGNDGRNIDTTPSYPAAYDLDNIVSVANLNNAYLPNAIAESSNYGTTSVDIAAPGTDIYSTVQPGAGDYDFKTGTSMAAPMVAGGLGLLTSYRPQYTDYKLVIKTLLDNRRLVGALQGKVKTNGTMDLYLMLSAPVAADTCPSDANKISPGVCGCGVAENYANSDFDAAADCVDGCPSDANKIAAGTCGCGVSDGDSDGDGAIDCQDGCPADAAKTSAGACGCGVADADGNGNGALDCVDALIANETPPAPKAKIAKGKIEITMTPRAAGGVSFKATIVSKAPGKKGKTKTKTVTSAKNLIKLAIPAKGTKLTISYAYSMPGFSSASSPKKSMTIK